MSGQDHPSVLITLFLKASFTARIEERKAKKEDFEGTLKFKMQYSKSPQELKFEPKGKCLVNLSTDTVDHFFQKSASFDLKSMDTYIWANFNS